MAAFKLQLLYNNRLQNS
jgi:hypothetical protein